MWTVSRASHPWNTSCPALVKAPGLGRAREVTHGGRGKVTSDYAEAYVA